MMAYALHRAGAARVRLALPAAGLGASAAGLALVSYLWYGIPVPGAQFLLTASFGNPLVGLPGNLFDQQSGLLFAAPVYILAVPGLFALRRRSGRLAAGLALIVTVVLVMAGTHGEWYGGETSPARYWTPALPALALGLAAALSETTAQHQRWLAILIAPGLLFAYLLVAMPAGNVRYGDPTTHHNVFIGVLERALGVNLSWLFLSFRSL